MCFAGFVGRLGDAGCVKYIEEGRIVELTARNIAALLAKLDDRLSARTLQSPCRQLLVRAVQDDGERGGTDRVGAAGSEGVVQLTREELWSLATTEGTTIAVAGFTVRSVPDSAHYSERDAGAVYMPESQTYW